MLQRLTIYSGGRERGNIDRFQDQQMAESTMMATPDMDSSLQHSTADGEGTYIACVCVCVCGHTYMVLKIETGTKDTTYHLIIQNKQGL